jgi:transposase
MDGDGMPLAFCIDKGNTNEQGTMTPLERKILNDFGLSRFVVCTDAGLASTDNRKFNNKGGRAFITTQSVKKLKKRLKEWALSPDGWHLSGSEKIYDISKLDEEDEAAQVKKTGKGNTYYKQQWINEDGLEQKLIVTFSTKYRKYQRTIREAQVDRAKKLLQTNPDKVNKKGQNDFRRFVARTGVTKEGEVADTDVFYINEALIEQEGVFDGFYAVCTNLEDGPEAIIAVNHRRWEIEECFRIMKSEFKSRPVYLSRDDRIKAHFTTCFLALLLYRLLEKRLDSNFTACQIIKGLREFNFRKAEGEGYLPAYTRDKLTDTLHSKFGFNSDTRIVTNRQMKNIFRLTAT